MHSLSILFKPIFVKIERKSKPKYTKYRYKYRIWNIAIFYIPYFGQKWNMEKFYISLPKYGI